jgi:hypothetical protein
VQLRLEMVFGLRNEHPDLAWSVFSANAQMLFSSLGNLEPLFIAQYVPQYLWNSLPLDQLEAWIKAHSPTEMSSNIAKGMEGARFKVAEKRRLVPAADAYLAASR